MIRVEAGDDAVVVDDSVLLEHDGVADATGFQGSHVRYVETAQVLAGVWACSGTDLVTLPS